MAEERRLCYVGMTRARKRLSLSLARCRSLFGELRFNVPSRFVRELPDGLTEGLASLGTPFPLAGAGPQGRLLRRLRPAAPIPRGCPAAGAQQDARVTVRLRPPSPWSGRRRSGWAAWAPARAREAPQLRVGTVEDSDGEGMNRKLVVRFGPGVGLKKVLARFIDPA